jgi:hypothetical protein
LLPDSFFLLPGICKPENVSLAVRGGGEKLRCWLGNLAKPADYGKATGHSSLVALLPALHHVQPNAEGNEQDAETVKNIIDS